MIVALAPSMVAFAAALLAFGGVMRTVSQKDKSDRRDQWWKRVQWAADLVRSDDDAAQQVGLVALTAMIDEADEIRPGDADLLQGIIEIVLGTAEDEGADADSKESLTGGQDGGA